MHPPASAAALEERFERLPIDQVTPSRTNPRQHFDEAYLAELAGSIKDKGVVQPILVRPLNGKAKHAAPFEIVAGECRFRASKLAEQTHIPAVIRAYSDEQVLELQLIENIHRKDLTALEQARGYRALINSNPTKHSAESIATRIGMSPAWVWDRMKLLDLVPEAQELLEQERMSAGHAILVARLKPEDQKRAIDPDERALFEDDDAELPIGHRHAKDPSKFDPYDGLKPRSIRELQTWITDHVRFDVAHMAKSVPLQFEQTAERVEAAVAQPGRGKKVIAITFDSGHIADDAKSEDERTYGSTSWRRADGTKKTQSIYRNGRTSVVDAPTCEYSVLGTVVVGSEHYGETFQVCIARDRCKVHWGPEITEREKNAKLRESGQAKKAAARETRQRESWEEQRKREEAERNRWAALRPHALAAAASKIKPAKLTDAVLQSVIEQMADRGNDAKELRQLLGGAVTAKNFTRALAILELLHHDWNRDNFKPYAKKYRIDLVKLEKDKVQTSGVQKAKKQ